MLWTKTTQSALGKFPTNVEISMTICNRAMAMLGKSFGVGNTVAEPYRHFDAEPPSENDAVRSYGS
jgi:hypothetical protein